MTRSSMSPCRGEAGRGKMACIFKIKTTKMDEFCSVCRPTIITQTLLLSLLYSVLCTSCIGCVLINTM